MKKVSSIAFFISMMVIIIISAFTDNAVVLKLFSVTQGLIIFSAVSCSLFYKEMDDDSTEYDDQVKNITVEIAKSYLIAKSIDPEFSMIKGNDQEEIVFPKNCAELAKSIVNALIEEGKVANNKK